MSWFGNEGGEISMARATANVILRFGLVSIEVGLVKATRSRDVKVDTAGPNGGRLKSIYVEDESGETVERSQIRHGIRSADGFREIPEADWKAIAERTKTKEAAILNFVPIADVPWRRATGQYYIQARPGYEAALSLLAAGMQERGVAAIGKVVLRTKQQIFALELADGIMSTRMPGVLVLNTLEFARNVSAPDKAAHVDPSGLSPEMVEQASLLIDTLTASPQSPQIGELEDDAVELKQRLVEQAIAGEPVNEVAVKETEPEAPNPLMEQLKKSLEEAT